MSPGDGTLTLPEPIVLRSVRMDDSVNTYVDRGPDIQMDTASAQQLMDELWHVGLRPTEGTGSAGSLAATQKHLADMRAIVGKQINVELPK
jgi:hypothetical protein